MLYLTISYDLLYDMRMENPLKKSNKLSKLIVSIFEAEAHFTFQMTYRKILVALILVSSLVLACDIPTGL